MPITSTIQADVLVSVSVLETLTGDALVNQPISHTGYNRILSALSSTSAIPVTRAPFHDYALVAGTKTIDLTAILDTLNQTVDTTGLKIQGIVFESPAGNAAMVITGEGANGYSLGSAHTIPAASGGYDVTMVIIAPECLADVAAVDRYLVVTGTGTQSFSLGLLLG